MRHIYPQVLHPNTVQATSYVCTKTNRTRQIAARQYLPRHKTRAATNTPRRGASTITTHQHLKQTKKHATRKTSQTTLQKLNGFLNKMQTKVYRQLIEYRQEKQQWPTYKELAEYMEVDKNTVQPRLTNDLKQKQLVKSAGKRPCKVSDHNISVNTWKTVIDHTELTETGQETKDESTETDNVIFSEKEEQSETEDNEEDYLLKDKETGEVIC